MLAASSERTRLDLCDSSFGIGVFVATRKIQNISVARFIAEHAVGRALAFTTAQVARHIAELSANYT